MDIDKRYRIVGYSYNPETEEKTLYVSLYMRKGANIQNTLADFLFKIEQKIDYPIFGRFQHECVSCVVRNDKNMSITKEIFINGKYFLIAHVQIYKVSYEGDDIKYRGYTIKRSDERTFSSISDDGKIGFTSLVCKESMVFYYIDRLFL